MTCGSFKAVCRQPEVESDRDFENIIVVWRWGKISLSEGKSDEERERTMGEI